MVGLPGGHLSDELFIVMLKSPPINNNELGHLDNQWSMFLYRFKQLIILMFGVVPLEVYSNERNVIVTDDRINKVTKGVTVRV